MNLRDEIQELEAKLRQLKRRAASAGCAEVGHRWKFVGGANAGCAENCICSVPVHECVVCGDCDYGAPAQDEVIAECISRESA